MKFEDLESWQKARVLVSGIYNLTGSENIKKDFGLSSQIQRAGVSIMTNIAEGFERHHLQEKIQFYNVARASAGEVRSLLYVVEDNYSSHTAEAGELMNEVKTVGKLVSGLIASTKKRKGSVITKIFSLIF
jgi:four helix bundle protein